MRPLISGEAKSSNGTWNGICPFCSGSTIKNKNSKLEEGMKCSCRSCTSLDGRGVVP